MNEVTATNDTTLGEWTLGTPLPVPVENATVVQTHNRVYLLGGWSNGAYSSAVYTAQLNADGSLGTWTTGTSLPWTVYGSQSIVTQNRVYLLGGYTGSTYSSAVLTAPINADGTLGTWTTGPSLPGTVGHSQAIVTKNRVYLLGGVINGERSYAGYTAPICDLTTDVRVSDNQPLKLNDIETPTLTRALQDLVNLAGYQVIKASGLYVTIPKNTKVHLRLHHLPSGLAFSTETDKMLQLWMLDRCARISTEKELFCSLLPIFSHLDDANYEWFFELWSAMSLDARTSIYNWFNCDEAGHERNLTSLLKMLTDKGMSCI